MKEQIQRLVTYEIMIDLPDMSNITCDKKPIPPKNIIHANITLVQNRFSVRVEERLSEVVW
jgi:hypothetical protein